MHIAASGGAGTLPVVHRRVMFEAVHALGVRLAVRAVNYLQSLQSNAVPFGRTGNQAVAALFAAGTSHPTLLQVAQAKPSGAARLTQCRQ